MAAGTNDAIIFTEEKAQAFLKTYEEYAARGMTSFVFEGHEFLVSFAFYLIQHLRNQGLLQNKGEKPWKNTKPIILCKSRIIPL